MDRSIVYAGSIPQDLDILYPQRAAMIALGSLAQAVLGSGTVVDGLTVAQAAVPALTVVVAPGSIHSLGNVDATAYGSLAADTTHSIVKQGVLLDAVTVPITPPGTVGYSQVFLIEAQYQEIDAAAVVLPYYNASNPSVPYSGPANAGTPQYTRRLGKVVIQVKAGTAATTGTQITPSVDAGWTALAAVTVANGATTILNAAIAAVRTAALDPYKFPALSNGFGSSIGSSGWQKLPSGLIIQWGGFGGTTGSLGGGVAEAAGIAVTFPIAFPTAARRVVVSVDDVSGTCLQETAWISSGPSTTGFGAGLSCKQASTAMTGSYFAIGN